MSLSLSKGLGLGLTTGMVFGMALEKSKVALPLVVRQQMVFQVLLTFFYEFCFSQLFSDRTSVIRIPNWLK